MPAEPMSTPALDPSIPSPQPDPSPSQPDEGAPSSRSTRSTVGIVLTMVVLVITLGTWLMANQEPSASTTASDAAPTASPSSDGSPTPGVTPGPGTIVRIDATTGAILARVPVPDPRFLASDGDSVWALHEEGTKLAHIDVAGDAVGASLDVGGEAGWLAAGGGNVWLSDTHGTLYRLAPDASAIEQAHQDVPSLGNLAPNSLVSGEGFLWMSWFPSGSCCDMELMDRRRVDPTTGGVIATIEGATQVVASSTGFVWAAVNVGPTHRLRLVRIDMETYAIERIGALGFAWADLTVAGGTVWASSKEADAIVRLDPSTGKEMERIRIEGAAGALAAGDGAVWAAIRGDDAVARYDIGTGRVETIDVGGTPRDLVFADGSIWVAVSE